MAFPVNGQTDRPRVYFTVSSSDKNPFSGKTGGPSSPVVKVKLYVTEEGTLCAEGPAFTTDGETVIFSKVIRAETQGDTLIIKNPRV